MDQPPASGCLARFDPVPRTRGDGPLVQEAVNWTQYLFPAHAGMDRSVNCIEQNYAPCSPHTRGWTDPLGYQGGEDSLFPAHAGMDRSSD